MAAEFPLVPQFRDLTVEGGGARFDELIASIGHLLQEPWSRDQEREEGGIVIDDRPRALFRRAPADDLPELLLSLTTKDGDAYVPNIVPVEFGSIEKDQYNAALVEFFERFTSRAAAELGLVATLGSDALDLRDELGDQAAAALTSFSRAANRSTGSSHPMDRERWFEFFYQVQAAGSEVSSTELSEWLVLDGWSEEEAYSLSLEFEFGMGLLRYGDRH